MARSSRSGRKGKAVAEPAEDSEQVDDSPKTKTKTPSKRTPSRRARMAAQEESAETDAPLDEASLMKLTVKEIQVLLKKQGLTVKGKKAELVRALLDASGDAVKEDSMDMEEEEIGNQENAKMQEGASEKVDADTESAKGKALEEADADTESAKGKAPEEADAETAMENGEAPEEPDADTEMARVTSPEGAKNAADIKPAEEKRPKVHGNEDDDDDKKTKDSEEVSESESALSLDIRKKLAQEASAKAVDVAIEREAKAETKMRGAAVASEAADRARQLHSVTEESTEPSRPATDMARNRHDQDSSASIDQDYVMVDHDAAVKVSRKRSGESVESPQKTAKRPKVSSCAMRIDNFTRPLRDVAVTELVRKFGNVDFLWMNSIKTHAYVVFSTEDEASSALGELNGLHWQPEHSKKLSAKSVDVSEAYEVVTSSVGGHIVVGEVPTVVPEKGDNADVAAQPTLPQLDLATLDSLFSKTKATPHLYYKPLSDEDVRKNERTRRL